MKHLKTIFASAALLSMSVVSAQTEVSPEWHIGLGGGFNVSSMKISDIDKSLFPDSKSNFSGVFSLYGEYEFGHENQFAVRAQLAFLTRGGRLNNIGHGYYDAYLYDYEDGRLEDVWYRLKATYFDIRIPLMYQFGKASWKLRPYVYVAPIVGFVTNGSTSAQFDYADHSYEGVEYDLSNANMASTYFAGAFGAGAKYQFDIAGCPFYIGLDLSYQLGFTDTYGKDEKDGKADNVVSFFPTKRKVEGSRKLSGFEMQASVGIPLSIFSKKIPEPVYDPVVEIPAPVEVKKEVVEKPCYTLDEIISMMGKGQSVAGKTICAIDDINFDFAKSVIKPSSYKYLDKLAQMLVRTNATICVKGHTDNIGSAESNMELSKQRAKAVVNYLVAKGVSPSKLTYEYYGMSKPLTTNDTEEGRLQNRRVEFEIRNY